MLKNTPEFWKCWSKKMHRNISKDIYINGSNDEARVAEAFASHFESVYQSPVVDTSKVKLEFETLFSKLSQPATEQTSTYHFTDLWRSIDEQFMPIINGYRVVEFLRSWSIPPTGLSLCIPGWDVFYPSPLQFLLNIPPSGLDFNSLPAYSLLCNCAFDLHLCKKTLNLDYSAKYGFLLLSLVHKSSMRVYA